jgi:hypothetical protein
MQPTTLPDITTTGATTQLASAGRARWIAFTAVTQPARVGDATTGVAQGVEVPAGQTVIFPPSSDSNEVYYLSRLYYYLTSGGTLTVTYGAV